jgi:hypothetical protein
MVNIMFIIIESCVFLRACTHTSTHRTILVTRTRSNGRNHRVRGLRRVALSPCIEVSVLLKLSGKKNKLL